MNKTLLLLRHAKSSWDDPSLDDHERPLNDRGRKAARLIGRRMRKEALTFEAVLSSTSVRTRETAALVAAELETFPELTCRHDLYHASADQIIRILKDVVEPIRTVLVIGHNPGFEEFLETITAETLSLPTAALARIELELDQWNSFNNQTRGRLAELWRPKDMGRDES